MLSSAFSFPLNHDVRVFMPTRNAAQQVNRICINRRQAYSKTSPAKTLSIPDNTLTVVVLGIFLGYMAYGAEL
jgi:hypothetical protein